MADDTRALTILEEALGFNDPEERALYLARECGEDEALRARVDELLGFETSDRTIMPSGGFLRPLSVIEQIPPLIGPFKVMGEIARGGMGAVVKAARVDGLFEQVVAIKLIRGDLASERARARFAAERRILGKLQHPAIVRILDGGEIDGRPWLAMDFIAGLPVDDALDERGADRRERLHAFVAVCDAVAYAHRQLVIHADIKPSNILMDASGAVHLLDFGIARLIAEIDVDEAGDPYPLTRSFAAPERGQGSAPTVASDVYSLGVMLLVILGLGVPPVDKALVQGTRLPANWLGGDLAAIAARALADDPEARYPDAAALAQDIRRHLADLPVTARAGESWRYATGRFIRRHRTGLLLAGAVGTALFATAIGASMQYLRAENARSEADARFEDARAVARYLLFDMIPALEDKPGTLAQRVAAAEQAQTYLERLASARQASDALRLETAQGLLQLAILQGRSGRPNLHLPDAAAANLERADTIVANLPGREAQVVHARVHIEQLRLATWLQADLAQAQVFEEEAIAVIERLDPQIPALRQELAQAIAALRGFQGRFAEQEHLARAALAQLDAEARGDGALDRALLLSLQAEAIYYQQRAAEALDVYRRSLAIIAAEAERDRSPYVLDRLTKAEWEVGTTLLELKQYPEAITRLARAEALAGELAALDSADLEARRLLSGMRTAHAQALGLSGQTDAALAVLQANRIALARLYAAEGGAQLARDLAYAHTVIGETLNAAGRREAACAADRAARDQYEGLRARGWLNPWDEQNNLALVNRRIGKNCA